MATDSEKKKGFKLYNDYGQQFEKLSDEGAGQLIKAIFAYVNNEAIPPISDTAADMAFSFISAQIDRDRESYDRKCEINRRNGTLGGRPKKANGTEENRTEPSGTETRRVAQPNICTRRFDEFWQAYPKKTGKQAAYKCWLRIKPDADLFGRIMAAVKAACQTEQWQREGGRFIPNPATWLNQGRWDDEPIQTAAQTEPHRDPTANPWQN